MSRTPAWKKTSASRRVDTVAAPAPPSSSRRATSTDFAVLRWGRSLTPKPATRSRSREILASIRRSSSSNAGVGSAASWSAAVMAGLTGIMDPSELLAPRILRTSPLTLRARLPGLEGYGIGLCARFTRGNAGCDHRLLFLLKRLQRPRAFCNRSGQSLGEIRIRRQAFHRLYNELQAVKERDLLLV